MKQLSTLLYALLFCAALAVAGCSSAAPPAVESVTGSESITAGETGFIRWSFASADSVRISGLSGTFGPADIVYVQPDSTTTYVLTGYSALDSATASHTIHVVQPDVQPPVTTVETGGAIDDEPGATFDPLPESSSPSLYYTGATAHGDRPEQIRIMRVLPAGKPRAPSFHVALLDQYGNFLHGRDSLFGVLRFNCVGSFTTLSMTARAREVAGRNRPPVSIALCAEYTGATAPALATLEAAYGEFATALAPQDELSFIRYDHRVHPAFRLASPARLPATLSGGMAHRGGLSAVYKAAWTGLRTLKQSTFDNRALVLLTAGSENASLLYTAADVVATARSLGIPIYTIALGMDAETYSLRYLSDYTGGRFYQVSRADEVADILREIAYSYRAYYDVSYLPGAAGATDVEQCPGMVYSTLSLGGSQDAVREMRLWNADRQSYDPLHQVVVTFPAYTFEVPSIYSEQLTSLATLLKDNPDKSVELIGHAEPDIAEQDAYAASLRRAQAVREHLIDQGVQTAQVRIRGSGGASPMYYFAREEWQQDLNRRVEVRWLDPALLPFEIIAQTVFTEQEAERLTDEWAQRGQRAYYELVIANRTPAFRIKLWGFATYDSALDAKASLQKKYRVPLSVQ